MIPALCLVTALIELDAAHVGQWMLSRPIVVGPLLGLACDVPWLGLAGGALIELFCVDVLPVGASLPINGTIAASLFIFLAAGPDAVPASAALPAALSLGSVFRRVETRVRSRRSRLTDQALRAVEARRAFPFASVVFRGIALHAAATAAFLYVATFALGPALGWSWDAAPELARRTLDLAFMNAPWLALAALLYTLRPRG